MNHFILIAVFLGTALLVGAGFAPLAGAISGVLGYIASRSTLRYLNGNWKV